MLTKQQEELYNRYYLDQCKKEKISKGEISEVLAKVMAVAAGQKRLQMKEVMLDKIIL